MYITRCFRLVCFSLFTFGAFAQTGPAGVGNSTNNVLWLKADAGTSTVTPGAAVSGWNDQSGNAINVSQSTVAQQPLFQTNVINGFPALQFDNITAAGQNDKLLAPDSPILDNTNGYTFFTVSRPQFLNTNAIVTKRTNVSIEHSFMLFYYTGSKFHIDIQTTDDRFPSATAFSANTNYLLDVVYDGTLPVASRTKFYIGETLDKTSAETNSSVPDNNSPLLIGSTDAADDRPFGGYIPEVIIYRQALNKASRIIVNNYLSAKYNIALAINDKYAGDDPARGNYDREVAGIGMDTIQPGSVAGSNTAFATSVAGGFGLTYVSGFDAGDYILAGHAVLTNAAIQTDVTGMTGLNNCRWQRVWYVDVTNTGTAMTTNIEFDLSDGGMTPSLSTAAVTDYVLLYRAAQTGSWTELATASSLTGDKIRFNTYSLTLDGYYTIGTHQCLTSPLPVELIAFTAENSGRNVLLKWKTASELNNDFFTLERSEDGEVFSPVYKIPGAGTTTIEHAYERIDFNPGSGVHYYRLKQTDTNGDFAYSDIVSVIQQGSQEQPFFVYPNPNNGTFQVRYSGSETDEVLVSITDAYGRIVIEQVMTGKELQAEGIHLPEAAVRGYYFAGFTVDGARQVVRVTVE